jgi:hypothetical protein
MSPTPFPGEEILKLQFGLSKPKQNIFLPVLMRHSERR